MKFIISFCIVLSGLVIPSEARLVMGSLFGDGMVLQQQQEVNVWGWAAPDAKVSIRTSWGAKAQAVANRQGAWQTKLQTPAASFEPQTVCVVCGKDRTVMTDVLIGEVWFASGQSNMEMPLKGFAGCPTEHSNEYIASAGMFSGKIHFVTVPASPRKTPADTVAVKWKDCNSETAASFCAAAYFFGIRLQETLNCPVGLINSSLGATRVEGWTPREILDTYPDIDMSDEALGQVEQVKPAYNIKRELPLVFYNGMIHPFVGYGIKGFLWYQGEANVTYQCGDYAQRFANMVNEWRRRWDMGDLPFYYVEICPYEYWWAKPAVMSCALREQQLRAQSILSNAGMVCTNDLVHDYEYWQIHPCMKKEVGDRLCYWALSKTYGFKSVACQSPVFRSMRIDGNKAVIAFCHAEDGFNRNVKIEGFEICGPDSVFHKAQAGVNGSRVTVQASCVEQPIAVRYCFRPFSVGNLKSVSGLPVVSFRTDTFPLEQ